MHFTLHLSSACNMKCDYCYAPPRDGAVMSETVGRRVMDMAAETNENSCGIVFFGGEPLLHKALIHSLVEYGEHHPSGKPFHFKVTTNGVLLDDDFIAYAVRHGIVTALSLDGTAPAHDAHRRLANGMPSWDRVLPRLKALLTARPYSPVFTTVNPDTAPYLSDSVAFLMELGVKYMIVSLNYAADWTDKTFRILEREYKKLAALYLQWTREERKFYFSPFEVKLSSHINRHCYQKERCELAKKQVSVDAGGFLYPCVQFAPMGPDSAWCIGNVFDGINEAARTRIQQESMQEKAGCQDCALNARCNNTCGCLNWQTTRDLNTISPVLCRYEQMLMKTSDRIGEKLYRERNPQFLQKHYNEAYPYLSLIEDLEKEQHDASSTTGA